MSGRNRRNFSPGSRLEAAQPVLLQHYTVAAAATAMNECRQIHDGQMGSATERKADGKITHSFTHDT